MASSKKAPVAEPSHAPVAAKPVAKKAARKKAVVKEVALKKAVAKPKAGPTKGQPIDPTQRAHYIEVAAYYIAQRRGGAPGDPAQDYLHAAAEVDQLIAAGHFAP